jgi:hypothetical protein
MKDKTLSNKWASQPDLERLNILDKLRGNFTKSPLESQTKNKETNKEKDLLARFSLKEGNQRLEQNIKNLNELKSEIFTKKAPKVTTVQSPVIMDNLEEDPLPFLSIKSNVQYASGHKFNISNNKIILVKNSRRNGDFNEGVKEATSSDSKIGISPRVIEIPEVLTARIYEEANLDPHDYSYENLRLNEDLARKLRMKLDFKDLKHSFEHEMNMSSKQNTERKEELETQTLEIATQIRKCFDEDHKAPETLTNFYKIGRVLGKGAFGKVNLAMHVLAKRLSKIL